MDGRVPKETIQTILKKCDHLQIFNDYVTLKKQGAKYMGLCPFHEERTPSFTVDSENGLYYCFGCHAGGNTIQFLMEMENISFLEALKLLAHRTGVELDKEASKNGEESKKEALEELFKRITKTFQHFLLNSEEGREGKEYLLHRGVKEESIEGFQLGWAPGEYRWLNSFLRKKNYSPEFLKKTGMFSKKNPEIAIFRNRIIFPICDRKNNVIAFGGRSISNEGPKYINSSETEVFLKRNHLFGINLSLPNIRKTSTFTVVEGYMDVISLYQEGIKNVIAPLGTALTDQHIQFLRRYAERGVLLFDGDEAGQRAAKKAILLCEERGVETQVVDLPENEDPADIVKNKGNASLHNLLKYPINNFEYIVKKGLKKYDVDIPEGKNQLFSECIPFIDATNSEIKRDSYFKTLADVLDAPIQSVIDDFNKRKGNNKRKEEHYQKDTNPTVERGSELFLMTVAALSPELFGRVRNEIQLRELESEDAREIYTALEDAYRNETLSLDTVINSIENKKVRDYIIQRNATEEFTVNKQELVKDALKAVKRRIIEKKIRVLIKKIRRVEASKDSTEELHELLSEKMYLDEELDKLRLRSNG